MPRLPGITRPRDRSYHAPSPRRSSTNKWLPTTWPDYVARCAKLNRDWKPAHKSEEREVRNGGDERRRRAGHTDCIVYRLSESLALRYRRRRWDRLGAPHRRREPPLDQR